MKRCNTARRRGIGAFALIAATAAAAPALGEAESATAVIRPPAVWTSAAPMAHAPDMATVLASLRSDTSPGDCFLLWIEYWRCVAQGAQLCEEPDCKIEDEQGKMENHEA